LLSTAYAYARLCALRSGYSGYAHGLRARLCALRRCGVGLWLCSGCQLLLDGKRSSDGRRLLPTYSGATNMN